MSGIHVIMSITLQQLINWRIDMDSCSSQMQLHGITSLKGILRNQSTKLMECLHLFQKGWIALQEKALL